MKNDIMVAGGGGYIGSILCEELLKQDYKVVCCDRFFFGKENVGHLISHKNFRIIQNDIRFIGNEELKNINAIIDLTGISNDPAVDLNPEISKKMNLHGTMLLANKAKEHGVQRYLFSSSCSVYGEGISELLTEESEKRPTSLYAKLKIEAEKELLQLAADDFSVTLLRNATVYGYSPRMRFDLIVNIMTMYAYVKGVIYVLGGGKQWRPNVHVKDVAKAFITILDAPAEIINGQAFNIGSNEQNFQVIQVANMIREVVPYTRIEIVPDDLDKRSYHVDFSKIKNLLGYKVENSIYEGAVEVKQSLQKGIVDANDIKTSTIKYYKYLIDADKILSEVKLNGNLF
jgi:nucleoside-diphosphate-sugar epimerase